MSESVPYYLLEVQMLTREPIAIQGWWGSHIRSVLGISLRESCCPFPQADCDTCLLRFDCAFATAWFSFVPSHLTPQETPPGITTNKPHPFIIKPAPDLPLTLKAHDEIRFRIMILGNQTSRLAFWVVALKRMAKRGLGQRTGSLTIKNISAIDASGQEIPIINEESNEVLYPGDPSLLDFSPLFYNSPDHSLIPLSISFISPIRLRIQKEEPYRPTPLVLWQALKRRINNLCWALGVTIPEINGDEFYSPHPEGHWVKCESYRWSSSQQQIVPTNGYLGDVELQVPVAHLPWWQLGAIIGVGKMVSFGMGSFVINEN